MQTTAGRPRGLEPTTVRVKRVTHPSPSLVLVRLARPAAYEFVAGQFLYVFADANEKRAYSIASPPHDREAIDLCVKLVQGGPLSTYIAGLRNGDEVVVSRAFGALRYDTPVGRTPVFLATGTGVAPFRSILMDMSHRPDPPEAWLFLGSRVRENLPYHDTFRAWSRDRPTFHYVPVLSGSPVYWEGDRGWIQEAFLKRFPHPRGIDAYVCGLRRMVDDVRMLLQEHGVRPESIHVERYD